MGRLDDYEEERAELRPAEMSGRKTYESEYNEAGLHDILRRFRIERSRYVQRLESWEGTDFERSAFHPRLKKTMPVCGMLYFQAEHDDYHLARITELILRFAGDREPS